MQRYQIYWRIGGPALLVIVCALAVWGVISLDSNEQRMAAYCGGLVALLFLMFVDHIHGHKTKEQSTDPADETPCYAPFRFVRGFEFQVVMRMVTGAAILYFGAREWPGAFTLGSLLLSSLFGLAMVACHYLSGESAEGEAPKSDPDDDTSSATGGGSPD